MDHENILAEIDQLGKDIAILEDNLQSKKERLEKLKNGLRESAKFRGFSTGEIVRYSRQLIIPQMGVPGQSALKNSKVLVVGAGGLGCPSSLYLMAAGVGELHIVDYDDVELTNLHRQILHKEMDVGVPKVDSAYKALSRINTDVTVVPHHVHLNSSNITALVEDKNFDVVLDCTDNVATRYLLNDICVLHDIPLVSGSALQLEGQLTVYHYKGGPCYRCLFPVPPPPESVTSCGDDGVLGPVPGTIGVLQALEAMKIICNFGEVLSGKLLLFDAHQSKFRNFKLRSRVGSCEVCGDNPTITSPIDYEQFCGSKATDKVINIEILESTENLTAQQLKNELDHTNALVIDVRPEIEFSMCSIPYSLNLPYTDIATGRNLDLLEKRIANNDNLKVYVLCRQGNDSQRSVCELKQRYSHLPVKFFNVKGGLHAYSKFVDATFPVY